MQDIIDVFEKYANELGWRLSYGNQANQNLLQSDLTNDIYMLVDPIKRTKAFSEYGGSGYKSFEGSFLLVVKSNLDMTYYNQTAEERFQNRVQNLEGGFLEICEPITQGKYNENIKPLLEQELPRLEELINCSDYQIMNWQVTDVTDVFDVNLDGLIVNYKLQVL